VAEARRAQAALLTSEGTAAPIFLRERLGRRIKWWRRAGASRTVIRWLTKGVQARMHRRLDPFCRPEMKVDPEDLEWLHGKLADHVISGAVEPAQDLDYMAAAFIVKSGAQQKRRLVIDLKDLNEASSVAGIRFEGIPHLRNLLRPEDQMFSIDLESAFHHVPIAEHHRRFFTFSIAGMAFRFAAIPFGWSASPLIFTKVLRPFTKYLRCGGFPNDADSSLAAPSAPLPAALQAGDFPLPQVPPHPPQPPQLHVQLPLKPPPPPPSEFVRNPDEAAELTATPEDFSVSTRGLRCLMYLDDLIVLNSSTTEAHAAVKLVRRAVAESGLSVNDAKCNWEPTQKLLHLGVEINTVTGTFKVPSRRVGALRATAHELLRHQAGHCRWVPAKLLARLLGLAAASQVAVPTARLWSRACHDLIATLPADSSGKKRWHESVRLDRPSLSDIRTWAAFSYDHPANGRPIWTASSTTRTLHTDASTFAWGAVLDEWGGAKRAEARGYFGPVDRALHITAQELLAVIYGVDAFAEELRGHSVAIYIDASSVEWALRRGSSRSAVLMPMVRQAWIRWAELGLRVFIRPVRSKENPADAPSRYIDKSDWKLHPSCFQALSQRWGSHSIDLFATETNRQVPRFCTRWPSPLAVALDAFAISWAAEARPWINPPWDLLPRVLQKLRLEGASATVIAPRWLSATWWPDLVELAREILVFDPEPESFLPGHLGSVSALGSPHWQYVAVDVGPVGPPPLAPGPPC